ncbi:MAG: M23 family metallopeptidase [Tenericutes bacterium]|nr:M23 family metallopeptidase [Mycoplasmatota bacterium]
MSNSSGVGANVLAVANGVVVKKFWTNCGGNQVYVHHNINGKKYTSAYLHLSQILVSEGQFVSKDTLIGKMGGQKGTGDTCTTGAHLHLSIAYGLRYKDYWTYNDYKARLINPRQVINFPSNYYSAWSNRVTRY